MKQSLTESIAGWPAPRRAAALLLCSAVALAIAVLGGIWMGQIYTQPDAMYYLNLATGRPAMLPFASRQLAPLLVRAAIHLTRLPLLTAFTMEGALAVAIFIVVVFWLLLRSDAPRFLLAAVAGLFFWAQQFNALVMPDLLYAALLCVFLLFLRRRQFPLAALMMFPLVIARESTLLTLACFLLAGWRILRRRQVAAALAALVAGILVVRHLSANALPNSENISPAVYLFAKLPWNFVKTFLGINLWANLYPFCGVPRQAFNVHLGPFTRIGLCNWHWSLPLLLFTSAITSFGLLPCC